VARKWSPPSKLFAVLGVLLALATFVLVRGYAERARNLIAKVGHPVPVVVAARTLVPGTILLASMLEVRSMPTAFAPPGSVRDRDAVAGRALTTSLPAGSPLTLDRLAPRGAGPVAALVPPGLRAVPIPASLAAGTIRRGDRVDVLATFPGPRAHTELVASGLEVLQVERSDVPTGEDPQQAMSSASGVVLMLLVTADQTEELAYARAFASLSVALDGPEEVVPPEGP
jgi:Flp pilus assembly protein CpaB